MLLLINSAGWVAPPVHDIASAISRGCLVTAIAAIGMKTSLKAMSRMGTKPVLAIVAETLVLALLVCGSVLLMR